MVVAGGVFTLTLRSSGEANALIEVSEQLRVLEETLAEDLRNVQPDRSMMIIQPSVIHAMWRQEHLNIAREIGDDQAHQLTDERDVEREYFNAGEGKVEPVMPRADILAFFTDRPAASFRDPKVQGRSQFVVYGHAQMGELQDNGKWSTGQDPTVVYPFDAFPFRTPKYRLKDRQLRFTPGASGALGTYSIHPSYVDDEDLAPAGHDTDTLFPVAAENWHLARRATVIVDRPLLPDDGYYPAASLNDSANGLSAVGISSTDNDPLYSSASLPAANYLCDGRRDYIVNCPPTSGPEAPQDCLIYEQDVTQRVPNPEFDAPAFLSGSEQPEVAAAVNWIGRTQLPETPISRQAQRMGAYFLPKCASFKVEWALDISDLDFSRCDPALVPWRGDIIWVDPGNFAETVVRINDAVRAAQPAGLCNQACLPPTTGTLDCDACGEADAPDSCVCSCYITKVLDRIAPLRPDLNPGPTSAFSSCEGSANCQNWHGPSRFLDAGPDGTTSPQVRSTHVFYATAPEPSCMSDFDPSCRSPEVPDPLFPRALRITVDVYDPAGRLKKPIRHVMVLPVGQD